MKAEIEIINNIEAVIHTLNKIKEGMDLMTEQEIGSAKQIHLQLSEVKRSQTLSISPKSLALVNAIQSAVNEIMMQCQMHDILSQRVEHVIQIHRQLIAEAHATYEKRKYSKVLPDILTLNKWQTTDVQKIWAMNIKLITDSWQLGHGSCQMLEKMLSDAPGHAPCIQALRQVIQHSFSKSSPLYDELFMSSYWQQLDIQYSALNRQLHKEAISVNPEERLGILRGLEKLYTMQTERDILMRLLEENHLLSEEEMISDTKDSEGLTELF